MKLKSIIVNTTGIAFIACIEFLHITFAIFSIFLGLLYLVTILISGFPTGLFDPTLPDILLPLSFLGFLIAAIKKYIAPFLRTKNIKLLSHSLICVFAFLLIVSIIDIACRHFGTWGQIKSELISLDIAIKNYEILNGTIDTKEEDTHFLSTHPLKNFKLNGDKLNTNFWDSNTKPRVGVSWDEGSGNARFDLQSMYVLYTD